MKSRIAKTVSNILRPNPAFERDSPRSGRAPQFYVRHQRTHHNMTRHPIELLIEKADTAIVQEDFDTLVDIYSDDAILVVKPEIGRAHV